MNLFSRFFQENQEKFLAFAYSYLRDKAEAEDVVMESMIALWENRDRWEENSNLHALLLTIIKNKALHVLEHKQVRLRAEETISSHNLRELDWHAGPESVEPWAQDFRDWVIDKLAAGDEAALHDYRQQAPNAVRSHPSDEHLLPLYFARGAGGAFSVAHKGFTMGALGMDIYRFG